MAIRTRLKKQRFAKIVSLSPNSLPEGVPHLNPLPQAGEEANVKGACFDLRDEGSLREIHVNGRERPYGATQR